MKRGSEKPPAGLGQAQIPCGKLCLSPTSQSRVIENSRKGIRATKVNLTDVDKATAYR